jgi:hypothetical protein
MDDFDMITLTDIHLQRLHAEAARLAEEADRRLVTAKDTDDPDDWDRGRRPTASRAASSSRFRSLPARLPILSRRRPSPPSATTPGGKPIVLFGTASARMRPSTA